MFNWDNIQYKPDGKVLLLYRHERVFDEKFFKKNYKVADIGGWGHFSERIRQEGGECIVLDKFTEDQYFPNRVLNEPHMVFDICEPLDKFMECSYDLVTCFEVLEHVEDQPQAVKNMFAMLKKDRWVAGSIPVPGYSHSADDHVTFIDKETMERYLSDAGFVDILVEPTPSVHAYDPDRPSLYYKGRKP